MRVDEGDGSDGKRSITAQDTNRWPERDVAWLQHELKEVEKANQLDHEDRKVVVLTHHSPLFPGSGNPKYWYQYVTNWYQYVTKAAGLVMWSEH